MARHSLHLHSFPFQAKKRGKALREDWGEAHTYLEKRMAAKEKVDQCCLADLSTKSVRNPVDYKVNSASTHRYFTVPDLVAKHDFPSA